MRYRIATPSDLPTCQQLLDSSFRMSPAVRGGLIGLWTRLLTEHAITFSIIEDPSRPHPDSIEAFGLSVFVTDTFAERCRTRPRPYLSALVYEEMLAGRSPVLSIPKICAGNTSGGLNLVVLHFGLREPDMRNERTQRALQCGSAAFYFFHAGYRFNALLNEVYGPQHKQFMDAGGFKLVTDFSDSPDRDLEDVASAQRPYLFELRKEGMTPGAVNPLSFLFHSPAPQLGLSYAEQQVLVRALLNEPDARIGATLGVSVDAVKKTWRRTYEKVAVVAPYVTGASEREAADRRSTEKKRHLLEYLRLHPEELRPFARSGRRAIGSTKRKP